MFSSIFRDFFKNEFSIAFMMRANIRVLRNLQMMKKRLTNKVVTINQSSNQPMEVTIMISDIQLISVLAKSLVTNFSL